MVIQDRIVFYSLVLFILILPSLPTIILKPYKETLTCSKVECTVNASFLIPLKINRTSYNFKRYSKIEVREPFFRSRAITGRYRIMNRTGFNTDLIFINRFFYKDDARDIINHIKSSEDDIQIDKYWIGYKIR